MGQNYLMMSSHHQMCLQCLCGSLGRIDCIKAPQCSYALVTSWNLRPRFVCWTRSAVTDTGRSVRNDFSYFSQVYDGLLELDQSLGLRSVIAWTRIQFIPVSTDHLSADSVFFWFESWILTIPGEAGSVFSGTIMGLESPLIFNWFAIILSILIGSPFCVVRTWNDLLSIFFFSCHTTKHREGEQLWTFIFEFSMIDLHIPGLHSQWAHYFLVQFSVFHDSERAKH